MFFIMSFAEETYDVIIYKIKDVHSCRHRIDYVCKRINSVYLMKWPYLYIVLFHSLLLVFNYKYHIIDYSVYYLIGIPLVLK